MRTYMYKAVSNRLFCRVFQEQGPRFVLSQLLLHTPNNLSFSGETYSRKHVVRLEQYVIFTLSYELCPPTSLFFMETLATLNLTGCLYDTTLRARIE